MTQIILYTRTSYVVTLERARQTPWRHYRERDATDMTDTNIMGLDCSMIHLIAKPLVLVLLLLGDFKPIFVKQL